MDKEKIARWWTRKLIRSIMLRKINYVQHVGFYIPRQVFSAEIRERMRTHLAICTRIMGASTAWREWLLMVVQHHLYCSVLLKLKLSDACYCITSCRKIKIIWLLNNDVWQLRYNVHETNILIGYIKIYFLNSNLGWDENFRNKFLVRF